MKSNGRGNNNLYVERSSLTSNNYHNYRNYTRNINHNNNNYDVGSSSMIFDQSHNFTTQRDDFVDHNYYLSPNDELGLTSEFQKMNLANNVVPFDCNVSKNRPSSTAIFEGLGGFGNGIGNGNARDCNRFSGELNGLIQPRNQREAYYGKGGVPIVRGNKLYDCNGGRIPVQYQSMYGSPVVDESLQQYIMTGCKEMLSSWASSPNYGALLQHYGVGVSDGVNAFPSSQGLSRGNTMRQNISNVERRHDSEPVGRVRNFVSRKKIGDRSFDLNGSQVDSCDSLVLQTLYEDVQGNIYLMAKDQHGCRFLQKKFEDGSFEDVQTIFNEIINHVVELMIDPFGNYLIQKLLDVCNEEQRMKIVNFVTKHRGELVKICLNTHGTRVVQKLIDGLKTRKQISLIIRALEPGFLDLIKDLNGNHVVQRCLQCLNYDDNKFIFDAASKFCVEIATHRHGCCVLQRCIAHSNGDHRKKLIDEICSNAFVLGQDPFGNYVVQYVIEQKIPSAAAQLISQFEGKYVHLSMQKFSSHVVEKCLKFIEESQARIVYELLSVPHFEQLLQDPFANYVVQSALEVTKGGINESLVTAVRPHSMLRTNPYCKKIFTRGLVRK